MANRNKCFDLGILFMFITLAGGSHILVSDSEGFPTTAGSKLRRLGEDLKNKSSKPSESNNKDGNLGVGESEDKTGEGSGLAREAENGSPNSNNTTGEIIGKDDHNNSSSSGNSTKHGGSQSSNGNSTEDVAHPKKEKPKPLKNDDLGTKKNDSGSHPEQKLGPPQDNLVPSGQNLVPPKKNPKQNLVPPGGTKGSTDQTQNNDTVTHPPAKKEIEPPPGEGHNENSNDTVTDGDKEKSEDKLDNDANNRDSRNGPVCDEAHSCTDNKKIVVACLRAPGNEMQELSLLIQNKGEEALHVSISAPAFLKIDPLNFTLLKQNYTLVIVSIIDPVPRNASLSKIVINGGDGECILDVPNQYVNLSYKQRFFDGFSYSAIVTPMFGMYFLLFTVLAIVGSWICCKLRGKRRHADGIRYQELEMNLPETNLSTNGGKLEAESIDGWDEWDDTWEDAEAGRSSTRPIQTVSSNGLASRRSNKDGWDSSWDD